MASRKDKKLTAKEKRFIEEYLIDLNGTQAALRAGYSPRTAKSQAYEILKRDEVQAELSKAFTERAKRVELDQDYVLKGLKSVADRSMQAEQVTDRSGAPVLVEDADGDYVPAYTFNAAGANKALELIGKHLGMFSEKHEHEVVGKGGGPIKVEDANPTETARMIAFALAKGMKEIKGKSDE